MTPAGKHLIEQIASRGWIPAQELVAETSTQGNGPTWDIDDLIAQLDPAERCRLRARALHRWLERRPWWDRLMDRVAFALMDVAAALSFPSWQWTHYEFRLIAKKWAGGRAVAQAWWTAEWWQRYGALEDEWYLMAHDGWKHGRYV